MGAEQLSGVMDIIKRQSALKRNIKVDEKIFKKQKEAIKKDAQMKASVWHATTEVWDDGVINPLDTRKYLGMALAAVNNSSYKGSDKFGVFRM